LKKPSDLTSTHRFPFVNSPYGLWEVKMANIWGEGGQFSWRVHLRKMTLKNEEPKLSGKACFELLPDE